MNVTPILDALAELIREPTSNITAAAIGLAMVVLMIMIVVVALLALVAPGSSKQASATKKTNKKSKKTAKGGEEPPKAPTPTVHPAPPGARPVPHPAPPGVRPVPHPAPSGVRPVPHPAPQGGRPVPRPAPPGGVPVPRPAPGVAASGPAPASTVDAGIGPKKKSKKKRRRRKKVSIWLILGFLLGLTLASAATLYVSTSANEYCTSVCHSMAEPSSTWKDSLHKDIACVRCHEGRVGLTAPAGMSSRARSIYLAATGSEVNGRPVPSSRCLECHQSVVEKTIVGPDLVRMSHKEVVEAGSDCTDCHDGQGHTDSALSAGMPACLRCHNGEQASAACKTCHPKGDEASISNPVRKFGSPVLLPTRVDCGGCHDQTKCDRCHGLRMPHPEGFAKPQLHAKLAGFEGKNQNCARCHPLETCIGRCHGGFDAHGANWKELHKFSPYVPGQSCGCHDTKDFCLLCHDKGIKSLPVPNQPAPPAVP